MMVAISELDGSTGPGVFGGRSSAATGAHALDMQPELERIEMMTARVAKLIALRRSRQAERRIAITLFNFPPNAGNTGTAAHLSVFESVFNTLKALKRAGYCVDLPASADALRDAVIHGNASRTGAHANVHARINAEDHVRRERYLREIEAQWGPAPGKHQSDGGSIFVRGAQFGNVFVGVQPAFGYEGIRCASCSRRGSRGPMPSPPITAGCTRISARTPCCCDKPLSALYVTKQQTDHARASAATGSCSRPNAENVARTMPTESRPAFAYIRSGLS